MEQFEAPGSDTGAAEEDFSVLIPSPIVRVGGGALALAGVVSGVTGFQILVFIRFQSSMWLVFPALMLVSGVIAVVVGAQLGRARAWAAWTGLGLAIWMTLVGLAWNIFAIWNALFSLLAVFSFLVCLLALAIVPLCIGPSVRTTTARNRLYS